MTAPASADGPRWAGMSHQEIYRLVADGPGGEGSVVAERSWRGAAGALASLHQDLSARAGTLPAGWEGAAANGAHGGLDRLAAWTGDAAGHARSTADGLAGQAGLAAELRTRMPVPAGPAPPDVAPAGTALLADWAAADATASNGAQRAVELMQRYGEDSRAVADAFTGVPAPPTVIPATGTGTAPVTATPAAGDRTAAVPAGNGIVAGVAGTAAGVTVGAVSSPRIPAGSGTGRAIGVPPAPGPEATPASGARPGGPAAPGAGTGSATAAPAGTPPGTPDTGTGRTAPAAGEPAAAAPAPGATGTGTTGSGRTGSGTIGGGTIGTAGASTAAAGRPPSGRQPTSGQRDRSGTSWTGRPATLTGSTRDGREDRATGGSSARPARDTAPATSTSADAIPAAGTTAPGGGWAVTTPGGQAGTVPGGPPTGTGSPLPVTHPAPQGTGAAPGNGTGSPGPYGAGLPPGMPMPITTAAAHSSGPGPSAAPVAAGPPDEPPPDRVPAWRAVVERYSAGCPDDEDDGPPDEPDNEPDGLDDVADQQDPEPSPLTDGVGAAAVPAVLRPDDPWRQS